MNDQIIESLVDNFGAGLFDEAFGDTSPENKTIKEICSYLIDIFKDKKVFNNSNVSFIKKFISCACKVSQMDPELIIQSESKPSFSILFKTLNLIILSLLFILSIIGNPTIFYYFLPFQIKKFSKRRSVSIISNKSNTNNKNNNDLNNRHLISFLNIEIKSDLKNAIDIFIWYSSIIDFMFTVIVIPFQSLIILNDNIWILNDSACKLYSYSIYFTFCFSSLNIMAISFDRYFSIIHHFNYKIRKYICTTNKNRVSFNTYIWLLILTIISFTLSIPYLIFTQLKLLLVGEERYCINYIEKYICINRWNKTEAAHIFKISFILIIYILPGLIMLYTYSSISLNLFNSSKKTLLCKIAKKRNEERVKIIKILIADFVFYALSWFPLSFWIIVQCLNDIFDAFTIDTNQELLISNLLYLGPIINLSIRPLFRVIRLGKNLKLSFRRIFSFNTINPSTSTFSSKI